MYQKKTETDIRTPLEYGLGILSGKWKSRIICMLGSMAPLRYRDLKENLVNIKDGVLATNLNELISAELIEKKNDTCGHISLTEYTLSEKGMRLIPILHLLCRWSGEYYKIQSENELQQCLNCEDYKYWKRTVKKEHRSVKDNGEHS